MNFVPKDYKDSFHIHIDRNMPISGNCFLSPPDGSRSCMGNHLHS